MTTLSIDAERLLGRLREFGQIGRDGDGRLVRLAASDADKAGRDALVLWLRDAGLEVAIDRIGNIFGIWQDGANAEKSPVLLGSHIDTVIDAGIYDGCYGVLAGLEAIEVLKAAGYAPVRPIAIAAFTNEEGVRYAPDMMGSLVYADGNLYAFSETGKVALVEASPTGYHEKGRFEIRQGSLPTWTHPVVAGGRLYLRDQDTIYAYDVREKK